MFIGQARTAGWPIVGWYHPRPTADYREPHWRALRDRRHAATTNRSTRRFATLGPGQRLDAADGLDDPLVEHHTQRRSEGSAETFAILGARGAVLAAGGLVVDQHAVVPAVARRDAGRCANC